MAATSGKLKTTRRKFLLAAGATGAAAIAMPQVSRAQTATLKMQGSWGKADVFNEMAEDYVKRVNEMAGGRLRIDYLVGGSVVHPFQVFDGVHGGQIDAAHTVTVYWYGKHKAASLFGTGPVFGFNANEGLGWIHNGGGRELFEELQTQIMKVNIKSFFAMPMPTQPLGWFKKPITSEADLKGLKYRTVGLAADLFQAMGASVAQLPGGEIVPAMERGVIDGFEFNNPTSDRRFGAQDVAKVEGTASEVAFPSGTAGKTGTAEYGSGKQPPSHSWFIGYRGDLAFSVIVEGGGAGAKAAAPIASRFLTALASP